MKAILLSNITLFLSATIKAAVVIPRDSLVSRQSSPSLEPSIALRDISEGIVQLQPRADDNKDENGKKKKDHSPSPGQVLARVPLFQPEGESQGDVYRSPSPGEVLPTIPAFPKNIHPSRLESYNKALVNPTSDGPTMTRALTKAIRELRPMPANPEPEDSNSGKHRINRSF